MSERLEGDETSGDKAGSWGRERVLPSPPERNASISGGHPSLSRRREVGLGGHPWSMHISSGGSWVPGRDKGAGRESFPCAPG